MTKCIALFCVAATWPALADEPKLVDEKPVFAKGDQSWYVVQYRDPWMVRLSPDGRCLLYLKSSTGSPFKESDGEVQLRLRDLKTGKDTLLPIKTGAAGTGYTRMGFFDPGGNRLILPDITPVKKEVEGRLATVDWRVELVLYDVGAGKAAALDIKGSFLLAKFDRTGGSLLLSKDSRMSIFELKARTSRPLSVTGYAVGVCPAADVAVVMVPPERAPARPGAESERPRPRLVLYDIAADKALVELPSDKPSSVWDDWESQWTSDGRYLYYPGAKDTTVETPGGPQVRTATLSYVWDRIAGKRIAAIENAVAVGPGPTPTTMVLARHEGEGKGMFLHDAASGKDWTLDPNVRVQHSCGSAVVYLKPWPDGGEGAFVARIIPPEAPASAPK